jgi:hypothetical protein
VTGLVRGDEVERRQRRSETNQLIFLSGVAFDEIISLGDGPTDWMEDREVVAVAFRDARFR